MLVGLVPLDEKWSQDFQIVVLIEFPTKNDAVMVLLRFSTGEFLSQFWSLVRGMPDLFGLSILVIWVVYC
jgi:hypothetical protein